MLLWQVSASFTAANALLMTVRDGRLPMTASPVECRHTWRARVDPVTVTYEWTQAVVLSSTVGALVLRPIR